MVFLNKMAYRTNNFLLFYFRTHKELVWVIFQTSIIYNTIIISFIVDDILQHFRLL